MSYLKTEQYICILCAELINSKNDSKEHIFPNSIGGFETVTGLLCKRCNNEKGRTWDAELSRQFSWVSLTAGVKRDQGKVHPVPVKTISGNAYTQLPDGSMVPKELKFERTEVEDGTRISFTARSVSEATKKIRELKVRYPKFDEVAALKAATFTYSYLTEPLQGSLPPGGPEVGRSVIVMALAVAKKHGIPAQNCEVVLTFLRNMQASSGCYGWSYLVDPVQERDRRLLHHCVSIFGDPSSRRLLAYVELFSYGRWHIMLSDRYDGPKVQHTYAINPGLGTEIPIAIDWALPLVRIDEVLRGDGFDILSLSQSAGALLDELTHRSTERAYRFAYRLAVDETMQTMKLAPETMLDAEQVETFTQQILERMSPFFKGHQMQRRALAKHVAIETIKLGANGE